jgi:cytochrome c oxidase assembly protein Cox11
MVEQWSRARCVISACRTTLSDCGTVCHARWPLCQLHTVYVKRLSVQTVEDKIRARQENPDAATEEAAAVRELTVTFNADVNDGMPWRFLPSQRAVKVMAWLAASHNVQLQGEDPHHAALGHKQSIAASEI